MEGCVADSCAYICARGVRFPQLRINNNLKWGTVGVALTQIKIGCGSKNGEDGSLPQLVNLNQNRLNRQNGEEVSLPQLVRMEDVVGILITQGSKSHHQAQL
jgi:hypothetical protein